MLGDGPSVKRESHPDRRPRIHYHTDCSWFAGCETMLVNLISSPEIRERFDVSLSYRESPRYTVGLRERVSVDFPVFALRYRAPSDLFQPHGTSRAPLHRVGRAVSRPLSTLPLLAYEIWLLRSVFRRLRPDVLHINNGGFPGALSARAAAIAGRMAGVPHIIMVVNNLAEGYGRPGRWLGYGIDRAVAASTDLFVAGSLAAAERVRGLLRLGSGRAVGLSNGADLRKPTETVAETRGRLGLADYPGVVFGIVGVMEPRKGHRVLLEAVQRVAAQAGLDPDRFRLLLLGAGPLRKELERLVVEKQLTAYCQFLGEEPNGMNVISSLDVLVLPSVAHEDFPNVVIEAMGAGKAVIASSLAGTPEQIADGVTGLLLPPGDAGALAAAMTRMIAERFGMEEMGRAGRRRFEECFTAAAAVSRYAALYESLINEDGS
jgi:glycosyltransferase involved in cell wall biosynthesis